MPSHPLCRGPLWPAAGARALGLLALLLVAACRTGANYADPAAHGGSAPAPVGAATADGVLRVVTFNVKLGKAVSEAADLLGSHPELRGADLVLLQEMDERGVAAVARSLGMGYAYYPAVRHLRTGRDFGNAVLSPWPILEHEALLLPHVSLFTRTQRIATAATVRVEGERVRVYSVHLGTQAEIGDGFRDEQLERVLDDAGAWDRVVIGGDMNSGRPGLLAERRGYRRPTEDGPFTAPLGRWDHVFVRGFGGAPARAGTVEHDGDVSDHRPVWVALEWGELAPPPRNPAG